MTELSFTEHTRSTIIVPKSVDVHISLMRRLHTDDTETLSAICDQNLLDTEVEAILIDNYRQDARKNNLEYLEFGLYPAQPKLPTERLLYTYGEVYTFALARRALDSLVWDLLPATAKTQEKKQLYGPDLAKTLFATNLAEKIDYVSQFGTNVDGLHYQIDPNS